MPRIAKPVPPALARRAAVLRARRELDDVEEMRFVRDAVAHGLSQDAVAEAIGASQATVSRIVKKVTEQPQVLMPSVSEVVNRAVVKEISRPEMVRELRALKLDFTRKPGSGWASLRSAVRSGLVSRADVEEVAEDAARTMVARVAHSMSLEAQEVPKAAVDQMVGETKAQLVADLG